MAATCHIEESSTLLIVGHKVDIVIKMWNWKGKLGNEDYLRHICIAFADERSTRSRRGTRVAAYGLTFTSRAKISANNAESPMSPEPNRLQTSRHLSTSLRSTLSVGSMASSRKEKPIHSL